jgi:hypothetical protein
MLGKLGRRLGVLVASAVVAVSMDTSMAQAEAVTPDATGGGCSSIVYFSHGYFNVCIGAPSSGYAQPDMYVTMDSQHPACKIYLEGDTSGGAYVSGTARTWLCPSGAFTHLHLKAGLIHNTNVSYYKSYGEVGLGWAGVFSPVIRLP